MSPRASFDLGKPKSESSDCGFDMNFVIPDFYPAAAELFVVAMSFVVLMVGTFSKEPKGLVYYLTQLTLLGAAAVTVTSMDGQVSFTFSNMYVDDLMDDGQLDAMPDVLMMDDV